MRTVFTVVVLLAVRISAGAQSNESRPLPSVPISDIRYDVTFDSLAALNRNIGVAMTFNARAAGDVLLSLPAWTPGSYEIDNFARYVVSFAAAAGSSPLTWDKTDQDTWRVHVPHSGEVRVSFDYRAMTLDNGNS